MTHTFNNELALRQRAKLAFPNGVYGHQSIARLSPDYPQFIARTQGARLWDTDNNEYIDYMCGYGTNLLGYHHPKVDEAASKQQAIADAATGPSPLMLELAEKFNDICEHADWSMFAKNGNDATTICVMTARAQTTKNTILIAEGAYHGSSGWCTPQPSGVAPGDRQHQISYTYNDVQSLLDAVNQAGDDLAAIIVTPFKHNAFTDQELPTQDFADTVRRLCDTHDAALILDDVRCALRFTLGSTWETLGVLPDLCAMSKSVANGYALSVVTGNNRFRDGASKIYATGSFWFASASFAASLATIKVIEEESTIDLLQQSGDRLRSGMQTQAAGFGYSLRQTGPSQMPLIAFDDDPKSAMCNFFFSEVVKRGVYMHPWHNMFISGAHTAEIIDETLIRTEGAFVALKKKFG